MRPFIRFISSQPRAWVQVSGAVWRSNRRVSLDFVVRAHRQGPVAGRWRVDVIDVKEFSLTDVDGGGLAFTRRWHPVLQQYLDPVVSLRITRPPPDVQRAIGALWRGHVDAVDDWVRPDRYLGSRVALEARLERPRGIVCRGPAFLVRRYSKVLAQHGARTSVSSSKTRGRRSKVPLALRHFGSSFIVAASFAARRERSGR